MNRDSGNSFGNAPSVDRSSIFRELLAGCKKNMLPSSFVYNTFINIKTLLGTGVHLLLLVTVAW